MTPAVLRAVLVGQMPSGKNQIRTQIVHGHLHKFPQESFERWRATGYAQLDRQRGAWAKLLGPARIVVRYTKGDLIRRDVPGIMDALCHLLEWCPVHGKSKKKIVQDCRLPFLADDCLLEDWVFEQLPINREAPRLELEVTPK